MKLFKKLFKRISRKIDFNRRGITIWPGAYVYPTADIGCGVSVGRNAEIGDKVYIGCNTRIGHGAFIPAGVTVEAGCFIGPGVIFTNDNFPPSPKDEWRNTLVRSGAAIGAGCVIKPGIVIGERAMIGCGSVVTKSVPGYEIWAGNPARRIDENLVMHVAGIFKEPSKASA